MTKTHDCTLQLLPFLFLTLSLSIGCDISEPSQKTEPIVQTRGVIRFTDSSAKIEVLIEDDGGSAITGSGACIDILPDPDRNDNCVITLTKTGAFTVDFTSLNQATKYYVRAFAVNKIGYGYGESIELSTSPGLPSVKTLSFNGASNFSVLVNAEVEATGGAEVTQKGVCLSTNALPTTNNTCVTSDSLSNQYSALFSGLSSGPIYHVRAYARNSAGLSYGNELRLLFDINSNTYSTIKVGSLNWMANDLRTTSYNDGEPIGYAPDEFTWKWGGGSYYSVSGTTDSYFYNPHLINYNSHRICPSGWRLAAGGDWNRLRSTLGATAGRKLKSVGWANGTNEIGFNGTPVGFRISSGHILVYKEVRYWHSPHGAVVLRSDSDGLLDYNPSGNITTEGFSIRCVL